MITGSWMEADAGEFKDYRVRSRIAKAQKNPVLKTKPNQTKTPPPKKLSAKAILVT